MIKEDKVLYLANVASISTVDGEVSPLEAQAIECVREEIGASEEDLRKALTSVAHGDHQITPVGRFSDRVRNLEDMIFVSLSDGELSKPEKPEVISFAKSIMITQDMITKILSESKIRLASQKAFMICTSCNNEISTGSKFCPQCGAKAEN